ncbi:MAG: FtsW/RodA/SpoVE family cell cycle protein [Eubacteriales bacterium]|nr:FtsW/RodA/SpoVE family cell cycle protein [Eubacteriales bacterium]
MDAINQVVNSILSLANTYPVVAKYVTTGLRWIFVLLAVWILLMCIISLLSTRATPEVWGYLYAEGGTGIPITHWENIVGRSSSVDLRIKDKTISKSQALLIRRSETQWMIKDLGSTNGTTVNGHKLIPGRRYLIEPGDKILFGGVKATLASISLEETRNNEELRMMDKEPLAPWSALLGITAFQILTVIQLILGMGTDITVKALGSILLLGVVMWVYVLTGKAMGRKGFEIELIAFFMSTISLAITASSEPERTFTQLVSVVIGLIMFFGICLFLRDLKRTERIRPILAVVSVILLAFNLVFGQIKYGAANWVYIGSFGFQPSELVKIVFILVGAATLEELFQKKNLLMFALFSFYCLGCLAVMGDFGTALIFFVAFLIISFLRSGDLSRMILTVVGAGLMGLMILRFKPYIADRFAIWGHVWDDPANAGYQQVRTMCYSAGGGLLGLGAGNGSLKTVGAANTDLVFGMVTEEWGLIISVLLILCIITLCVFAVNSIMAGRSTFYTIGACGAATIFLFQTMLNVFGAVDLFPLTGVTFPFVSAGGTSMMASWAILAFFKAADMRKDASIAIKKSKVKVSIPDSKEESEEFEEFEE